MSDIELHVHTGDDKVHRIDAPANLKVEDFLKELVELLGLSPATLWSLDVKNTGRTLDPARSLGESGLSGGEDLYLNSGQKKPTLVPCKHCGAGNPPGDKFCRSCGKPLGVTHRDIQVHLYTPTGQKHSVRISPDMTVDDFITTLISDLELEVEGSDGQRISWRLYDKEASKTLEGAKSLAANGIVDGHHLYLQAVEEATIQVEVYSPNGDRRSKKVLANMSTRELIRSVEADFSLKGKVVLFDKDTSKALNAAKTLSENGVLSGHHLYVRVPPPPKIPWRLVAKVAVVAAVTALSYGLYHVIIRNRPLQLSPSRSKLSAGQTLQFTAKLRGGSVPVRWVLSPEVGSISEGGLYTAPRVISSPQVIHITAATATDPPKSGSAEISLEQHEQQGIVSTLTISPAAMTLGAGDKQKFAAAVDGQESSTVKWTLEPKLGQIEADGTYTAPSPVVEEQTVEVRAVGSAGSAPEGSATVTLKPLAISLRNSRSTLSASERLNLHATVTSSSNTNVRWTLNGPGYISPSGVYFAPAQILAERTVVIAATSSVDPTKSASIQILLKPTVAISLSPLRAQLGSSARQQFSATVSGSANGAVKWSLMGPGILGEDGLYVAPASVASLQDAQITATSLAQSNKFATATVTLVPMSVSISPATAVLQSAESVTFQATVNWGQTHLTWRVLSGPGQVTSNGVYTAPSHLRADETAQVTVYSSSDPSKRATAILRLVGYHGPTSGGMIWSGQVPKNGTFSITGGSASAGAVQGQPLPKVPVQVSLSTRDFTIVELPGPSNNFNRLTIRSEKGKKSNLAIGWTVQ